MRAPPTRRGLPIGPGLLLAALLLSACESSPPGTPAPPANAAAAVERAPVRITMEALHQAGGTPPGWRFLPPRGDIDAGRRAFAEHGCHSCHAVQGESFPASSGEPGQVGPELTGMGGHHPPEYFAEAILNPDAVLIEGPGYISDSGRSTMPAYPDMSLRDLADLVAYIGSLQSPPANSDHCAAAAKVDHATHGGHAAAGRRDPSALSYFAQAYEVDGPRLDDFYKWFDNGTFHAVVGLVRIDTYVSRAKNGKHTVLCLFGLENDGALYRFLGERQAMAVPGDFIRPVAEPLFEAAPVYRAVQISTD